MRKTTGYALLTPGGRLEPWAFERRDLRPDDVAVRVTYCGVCHSDLHAVEGATEAALPLVPGHEFVGVVSAVGGEVTRFRVGDAVAVGNIVDSCGVCEHCRAGEESYCREFPTLTYGGVDRRDGRPQRGGYSSEYVATEAFVYALPPGLDPAGAAPLMCAGVTTWSPLRHWDAGPGDLVGVVGLGGLGHLAVKFAKALGARVAVFTTSPGKAQAALELGADEVVVSSDAEAMAAQAYRFDLILDTASAKHDPSPFLRALRMDGTLCMLGIPDRYEVNALSLLLGRRNLSASGSGGRRTTQEMLEFCAEHGITADVEVLPAAQVGTAFERLARGDVRGRLVLDMGAHADA
ncbi:NAD(P)-dependent alcohol dehydrogenase [Motilibacter deserti]|uniref:alcohol dehydrogenase (NADP(+)) n=1 Tax=Motilibacter deserti TaxID=2714956 RepID=A0ABX0H043_9ACTN|nr:NAD(P)-dependent alcohol dehydrogenase [Motilibacter deserti]NHC15726.1 NAD(P)-dependent alcohol dehydrogenase [Motilibacter deserti]